MPPRPPDGEYARDFSRASGLRAEEEERGGVDQAKQLNTPLRTFDLSHAYRPVINDIWQDVVDQHAGQQGWGSLSDAFRHRLLDPVRRAAHARSALRALLAITLTKRRSPTMTTDLKLATSSPYHEVGERGESEEPEPGLQRGRPSAASREEEGPDFNYSAAQNLERNRDPETRHRDSHPRRPGGQSGARGQEVAHGRGQILAIVESDTFKYTGLSCGTWKDLVLPALRGDSDCAAIMQSGDTCIDTICRLRMDTKTEAGSNAHSTVPVDSVATSRQVLVQWIWSRSAGSSSERSLPSPGG